MTNWRGEILREKTQNTLSGTNSTNVLGSDLAQPVWNFVQQATFFKWRYINYRLQHRATDRERQIEQFKNRCVFSFVRKDLRANLLSSSSSFTSCCFCPAAWTTCSSPTSTSLSDPGPTEEAPLCCEDGRGTSL